MSKDASNKQVLTITLALFAVTTGVAITMAFMNRGEYVPLVLLCGAIVGSYLPMRLPPLKYDQTLRSLLDGVFVSVVLLVPYVGLLYLLRAFGVFSFNLTIPSNFGMIILHQVLIVALPEEFFFRATIQAGLDEVLKPKWKLFGVKFGWGLFIGSLLFGSAHVGYQGVFGLTTAVPALIFGLLYLKRGNVAGSAIFHAACNLVMICFPAFSHRTFS